MRGRKRREGKEKRGGKRRRGETECVSRPYAVCSVSPLTFIAAPPSPARGAVTHIWADTPPAVHAAGLTHTCGHNPEEHNQCSSASHITRHSHTHTHTQSHTHTHTHTDRHTRT